MSDIIALLSETGGLTGLAAFITSLRNLHNTQQVKADTIHLRPDSKVLLTKIDGMKDQITLLGDQISYLRSDTASSIKDLRERVGVLEARK